MMPYDWRWSSLQFTGQADIWHPHRLCNSMSDYGRLAETLSERI
jgi:hypothetical protein